MDNEGSMRINTTHKEQLEVPDSGAYLLAVVEVDREDRIQCQAEGRGHSVYKRIHVVLTGMAFKVLGSQCYERLYGQATLTSQAPQYGTAAGKRLTPEERLLLVENTAAFIEGLETERVELERRAAQLAAQQRENEFAKAPIWVAPPEQRPERPQPIVRDASSPMYEGGEMLRWRWRNAEAITAGVAKYQACPSQGPFHACVMASFRNKTWQPRTLSRWTLS
jgi:hypothetical protein